MDHPTSDVTALASPAGPTFPEDAMDSDGATWADGERYSGVPDEYRFSLGEYPSLENACDSSPDLFALLWLAAISCPTPEHRRRVSDRVLGRLHTARENDFGRLPSVCPESETKHAAVAAFDFEVGRLRRWLEDPTTDPSELSHAERAYAGVRPHPCGPGLARERVAYLEYARLLHLALQEIRSDLQAIVLSGMSEAR